MAVKASRDFSRHIIIVEQVYNLIGGEITELRWHIDDKGVYLMIKRDDRHDGHFMKNIGFTPPAYVRTDVDGVFRSTKMTTMMMSHNTVWELPPISPIKMTFQNEASVLQKLSPSAVLDLETFR
ncbi:predicted protein [Histoplasma capsulatum H143]|uniref:Uncharacterized protein n=1 Tax=Ajellomyces capsulatus (strain H143) TaxID=544712 RepID=C6HI12_AJECH|nr:predicted protein [Histoplasma capsulatum H143]